MSVTEIRPVTAEYPQWSGLNGIGAAALDGSIYSDNYPREELASLPYQLCKFIGEEQVEPEAIGIPTNRRPGAVYRPKYDDPYENALRPDIVQAVRLYEDRLCELVGQRHEAGLYDWLPGKAQGAYVDADGRLVTGRGKKEWGDQLTLERLRNDIGSPGMQAWHATLPRAAALRYVYEPFRHESIYDTDGKYLGPNDDLARIFLAALSIPRDTRIRNTDAARMIMRMAGGDTLEGRRIACYGSGTALGPMIGARLIRQNNPYARDPELLAFDMDSAALKGAGRLACDSAVDFRGKLTTHKMQLLDRRVVRLLRLIWGMHSRDNLPYISEFDGLREYMHRAPLEAMQGDRGLKVSAEPAVDFLRTIYKSTSRFVRFSQLSSDCANKKFLHAIGWPYLDTLSPAELMESMYRANIPLKQVELRLLGDTYIGCVIDKSIGVDNYTDPRRRK